MPNWCNNAVEISGPTDAIDTLWQDAHREDKGLLSAMAPLDEWDYKDAIGTWGTKWDVDMDETSLSLHTRGGGGEYATITGHFDTAWGPPTEAFNTWLENNPECEAELLFFEGGNDFCGSLEHGDIAFSQQSKDFFLNTELGVKLDEAFGLLELLEEYEEEAQEEALTTPITLLNPEEEPQ